MAQWVNFTDGLPPRRGWYLHRQTGKLHVIFVYQTASTLPQLVCFQVGIDTWTPLIEMDGAWLPVDLKEVEKQVLQE